MDSSDERKFLHDISSPLASGMLDLEMLVMLIEENASPTEINPLVERLGRSFQKMCDMVSQRRELVKAQNEAA